MEMPFNGPLVHLSTALENAGEKRRACQAVIAQAFGAYMFDDGPPPSHAMLKEFALAVKAEIHCRKIYSKYLCKVLVALRASTFASTDIYR